MGYASRREVPGLRPAKVCGVGSRPLGKERAVEPAFLALGEESDSPFLVRKKQTSKLESRVRVVQVACVDLPSCKPPFPEADVATEIVATANVIFRVTRRKSG